MTSGLTETVNDADGGHSTTASTWSSATASGVPLPVDRGWVVGTNFDNRTATGLWPSDHGGVVIRLRP